jgi:glutamate formiminotransferase
VHCSPTFSRKQHNAESVSKICGRGIPLPYNINVNTNGIHLRRRIVEEVSISDGKKSSKKPDF